MAVISHIPASESAFENGNHTFFINEIINFPVKKKNVLFLTAFLAMQKAIFDILSIYDTPHDFLRAFQNCL